MGKTISLTLILVVALLLISASCVSDVYSFDDFIDDLLDAGASVQFEGETKVGLLSAQAKNVMVNGERVHILEYDTQKHANEEADFVHPDGWGMKKPLGDNKFSDMQISWIGWPHYYKKGRLIAVYIDTNRGVDLTVDNLLTDILGSQFAGHPSTAPPPPSKSLPP
jgi:hypothetical protein